MNLLSTDKWWLRSILSFLFGVGTAIAATFATFETKTAHDTDIRRIESQRQSDRDELFVILSRIEDKIDSLRKQQEMRR